MILTGLDSGDVSYPSITCDSDSGIHIVWYDASSGNQDVYYLRGTVPGSGAVEEGRKPQTPSLTPGATIVRSGVLSLQSAIANLRSRIALLDASGRTRLLLRPGTNDVRCLPVGVYFVVGEPSIVRPSMVVIVK